MKNNMSLSKLSGQILKKCTIFSLYQYIQTGTFFHFNLIVNRTFNPSLARLYESTGRAIAVTTASASVLLEMLKFLVKLFKSLCLLNLWMDLVDILCDVRYWV